MPKKFKDNTVKPLQMLLCIVVLGISSYAFYLFVSPRTKNVNTEDSPVSEMASSDSKRRENGGSLSSRRGNNMSRQEYLAMVRERDAEMLRGIRSKKDAKKRSRRAFAQSTDPIQKWQEQVDQLRFDLKAASDHPEIAKDIKRRLENAISEKPLR